MSKSKTNLGTVAEWQKVAKYLTHLRYEASQLEDVFVKEHAEKYLRGVESLAKNRAIEAGIRLEESLKEKGKKQ